MRQKRLDDAGVGKLAVKRSRYAHRDPELQSHYVRVTPKGAKSFWVVTRDKKHKQVWQKVGDADLMKIEDARDKARAIMKTIRSSTTEAKDAIVLDASFAGVANHWFKVHAVKKGLRSYRTIRRHIDKVLVPAFADKDFVDVDRGHVMALLDAVEERCRKKGRKGLREADSVLSTISRICTWYALRNPQYVTPIVRGMTRNDAKSRERILSDVEIRVVWDKAFDPLAAVIKLALLTGQRVGKIRSLRWEDVRDGTWFIASEDREKGNAGMLKLPQLALDVLASVPRWGSFVFDQRSLRSRLEVARDELEDEYEMEHWTFHDLRRTSRSLMAAAGVNRDIAERVLGHAIPGVEGIYDRHTYEAEKADALERLAARIRDIVTPPPGNVHKFKVA